ncbi:MAG TPA: glycosyltransferase family 2 protein [Gammaproteobacteria bacterium]|nr:glycosyltransferase family 2 protein [Gammaproteobacteria bacterium]
MTVTYHPDPRALMRQVDALPKDMLLVIIDNASSDAEFADIERIAAAHPQVLLLRNDENIGLAAAVNKAVDYLAETDSAREFILLLDQDSEPQAGSIKQLLTAFLRLERAGVRVGCVGPRLLDTRTGLQHGFHCIRGWRWSRRFPAEDESEPVECANLNGSGTLMRTALFQELKGLDASLFIDHVDTEWAFRVLAHGHRLFGIPQAVFQHNMGDDSLRIWFFGWRVWPHRSPLRHYYLFRNAIVLMKRDYVPAVWKVWAHAKLLLTLLIHGVFDPERVKQVDCMMKGLREGWSRAPKRRRLN